MIFRIIVASRFGVADESISEPQCLQKLESNDIVLPQLLQYIIALLLVVIRLHFFTQLIMVFIRKHPVSNFISYLIMSISMKEEMECFRIGQIVWHPN